MASFRSRIVRFISRRYMKRVTPQRDIHELRRGLEARTSMLSPAHGVDVSEESIAGIRCELHVPAGCDDAPLIYYLHGGAYVMGSPATHRRLVSFIARAAGMRAVLPDYRLAPENRFPAALEDSLAVYRALLQGGMRVGDMAIGGDSAGGNLAMATLLSLRDSGEPLPSACFLMSPWLDLAGEGESHTSRARVDPWFRADHLPAIVERIVDLSETRNPLVSPVYADAAGLPPTFIQVGDHEILLSDSVRMADHIEMAGGRAEITIWPDMWHVFQFFVGQMPESMQAIADIGRFLQAEFHNREQAQPADQAA
jgi:acetyl esterase/lipase